MTNDFWLSVLANLVSSVIYTIVIALVVLLITISVVRRERRPLFDLLGIDPEAPVMRTFVSRLDVVRGGSQGTDGRTVGGFTGPALMEMEYTGALRLERLVSRSFLDVLPGFVRRAVQQRNHYLKRVSVTIDVSPDEQSYTSLLENGTEGIVLLGSDVYSHAVRHIYCSDAAFIRFVGEKSHQPYDASRGGQGEPTFAVHTDGQWFVVPGRSVKREIGTIQRVTLGSGRRIVMCAGISSSATCGSTRYLCENWRRLCDRFGTDDFLVVLAFRGQVADSRVVADAEELPDLERRRKVS